MINRNGVVIKNPWPQEGTVPVVTTDGRPVPVENLVAAAVEFAQEHQRNVLISEGNVMLPVSPWSNVPSLVAAFEAEQNRGFEREKAENPAIPDREPDCSGATRLTCEQR